MIICNFFFYSLDEKLPYYNWILQPSTFENTCAFNIKYSRLLHVFPSNCFKAGIYTLSNGMWWSLPHLLPTSNKSLDLVHLQIRTLRPEQVPTLFGLLNVDVDNILTSIKSLLLYCILSWFPRRCLFSLASSKSPVPVLSSPSFSPWIIWSKYEIVSVTVCLLIYLTWPKRVVIDFCIF